MELTRVIYMSKDDPHRDCPSCCGKPVAADTEYCPHCGARMSSVCPSCSKERRPEWIACPYCAVKFS